MPKEFNPQSQKKESPAKEQLDPNADELDLIVVPENSRDTSSEWSFSNLKFAQGLVGGILIAQANEISKQVIKEFGNQVTAPRLESIGSLFHEAMKIKESKDYIPIIQKMGKHVPGSMDDLLKCKFTYEIDAHKVDSVFAIDSIKSGSQLATAKASWDLAVNIFSENKENAEDAFREAVYAARTEGVLAFEKSYSTIINEITAHDNYYAQSVKVAAAVDQYCKSMATATTALTTAFNAYINALVQVWAQLAQSESTQINNRQKSSATLWTAIKAVYNKMLPGPRSTK